MARGHYEPKRPAGYAGLLAVFVLFVIFLYGPMATIFILSFQGPEGGLTFPLQGLSLHWFHKLAQGLGVVDIGAAVVVIGLGGHVAHHVHGGTGWLGLQKKIAGWQCAFLCHGCQLDHALDHCVFGHRLAI